MRDWWIRFGHDTGNVMSVGPDLMVKLRSWPACLRLCTLYDLGVPQTWRPTAKLSDYKTIAPRWGPPPPEPTVDPWEIRAIDNRPQWVDTSRGNAVVTEEQRVAQEQTKDDGLPDLVPSIQGDEEQQSVHDPDESDDDFFNG